MVGGVVKEVLAVGDRLWVNCEERYEWGGATECAIYVALNEMSRQIKRGDHLWWQGREAMWTPMGNALAAAAGCVGFKEGGRCDIPILRIGYSGALHPAQGMIERAYSEGR